ncbi:MAG: hypothetical protein IKO68_08885 [Oscillospiraceae bacterium]|nr:hypothetical protein [Oscillospiraceae bacterium]
MSNKAWRSALSCNPLDYTQERLQKERLALLKCVSVSGNSNQIITRKGFEPQVGSYYLAVSSFCYNPFEISTKESDYFALLLDSIGVPGPSSPYTCFEIVSDPCGVMARKSGDWSYWNRAQWRIARAENRSHEDDMVDEAFLRQNQLALVRYLGSRDAYGRFTPGQQYLALTHVPDLTPAVYVSVILKDTDGEEKQAIGHFDDFDVLSDPLGLLDPFQTEWKENVRLQQKNHPELYPKRRGW